MNESILLSAKEKAFIVKIHRMHSFPRQQMGFNYSLYSASAHSTRIMLAVK